MLQFDQVYPDCVFSPDTLRCLVFTKSKSHIHLVSEAREAGRVDMLVRVPKVGRVNLDCCKLRLLPASPRVPGDAFHLVASQGEMRNKSRLAIPEAQLGRRRDSPKQTAPPISSPVCKMLFCFDQNPKLE